MSFRRLILPLLVIITAICLAFAASVQAGGSVGGGSSGSTGNSGSTGSYAYSWDVEVPHQMNYAGRSIQNTCTPAEVANLESPPDNNQYSTNRTNCAQRLFAAAGGGAPFVNDKAGFKGTGFGGYCRSTFNAVQNVVSPYPATNGFAGNLFAASASPCFANPFVYGPAGTPTGLNDDGRSSPSSNNNTKAFVLQVYRYDARGNDAAPQKLTPVLEPVVISNSSCSEYPAVGMRPNIAWATVKSNLRNSNSASRVPGSNPARYNPIIGDITLGQYVSQEAPIPVRNQEQVCIWELPKPAKSTDPRKFVRPYYSGGNLTHTSATNRSKSLGVMHETIAVAVDVNPGGTSTLGWRIEGRPGFAYLVNWSQVSEDGQLVGRGYNGECTKSDWCNPDGEEWFRYDDTRVVDRARTRTKSTSCSGDPSVCTSTYGAWPAWASWSAADNDDVWTNDTTGREVESCSPSVSDVANSLNTVDNSDVRQTQTKRQTRIRCVLTTRPCNNYNSKAAKTRVNLCYRNGIRDWFKATDAQAFFAEGPIVDYCTGNTCNDGAGGGGSETGGGTQTEDQTIGHICNVNRCEGDTPDPTVPEFPGVGVTLLPAPADSVATGRKITWTQNYYTENTLTSGQAVWPIQSEFQFVEPQVFDWQTPLTEDETGDPFYPDSFRLEQVGRDTNINFRLAPDWPIPFMTAQGQARESITASNKTVNATATPIGSTPNLGSDQFSTASLVPSRSESNPAWARSQLGYESGRFYFDISYERPNMGWRKDKIRAHDEYDLIKDAGGSTQRAEGYFYYENGCTHPVVPGNKTCAEVDFSTTNVDAFDRLELWDRETGNKVHTWYANGLTEHTYLKPVQVTYQEYHDNWVNRPYNVTQYQWQNHPYQVWRDNWVTVPAFNHNHGCGSTYTTNGYYGPTWCDSWVDQHAWTHIHNSGGWASGAAHTHPDTHSHCIGQQLYNTAQGLWMKNHYTMYGWGSCEAHYHPAYARNEPYLATVDNWVQVPVQVSVNNWVNERILHTHTRTDYVPTVQLGSYSAGSFVIPQTVPAGKGYVISAVFDNNKVRDAGGKWKMSVSQYGDRNNYWQWASDQRGPDYDPERGVGRPGTQPSRCDTSFKCYAWSDFSSILTLGNQPTM